MPRDGSNIYNLPFPAVVAGTTISSGVYNGFTNDVALDLNTPRPIVAGGTGATSADAALAALSGQKAGQIVTNYDSHVWLAGSFYSATTATGEPVDGRAFSGIVYMSDSNNIVVEARDATDGKLYIRRKTAGVWGSWILDGDLSGVNAAVALKADIASPTFTGDPKAPTPSPGDNDTSIATTAFVTAADAVITTNANSRVLKAGDTMTGALTLPAGDPASATHAANKQYVDQRIRSVKRQVFTVAGSATYTPSTGMVYCVIECIGSGAGGGGVTGSAGSLICSAGGGAGGYSRLVATAATIGASQTVVVGVAGTAGAAGSNSGGNGGDSFIGSLCIAKGGSFGTWSASGTFSTGGAGGVVGTGDVAAPGGRGSAGMIAPSTVFNTAGDGGDSALGSGGKQATCVTSTVAAGVAGSSYGGGGSGAQAHNTTSTAAGGAGAAGIVIITEFCNVP